MITFLEYNRTNYVVFIKSTNNITFLSESILLSAPLKCLKLFTDYIEDSQHTLSRYIKKQDEQGFNIESSRPFSYLWIKLIFRCWDVINITA